MYQNLIFMINHRLYLSLLLLIFVNVGIAAEHPADVSKPKKPNIFFAIADDWGVHASIYGDPVIKTPTFDKIAKSGVLFNHAFVSSPSCTPSRGAILTGQHFWRLGPGANLWSELPKKHVSYPDLLRENGYAVGFSRKGWGPGKDRAPPAAGDRYKNFKEFLAKKPSDKPFCFWFGAHDPHRTYKWQSGINSGMDPSKVMVPPYLPDTEKVRTDICDYYFEVQRFDAEVGERLKMLEEIGELENTIVVMTGDHGWPFPRGKSNLYDAGARVPLAIQWGSTIKAGRVVEDFVSLTDLAPTFLDAAGIDKLDVMTGKSLMEVLKSEKSGWIDESRDHVFIGKERHTPCQPEGFSGTPMRGIRTKDFLYIHNFNPDCWPAGGPKSRKGKYADIDGGPTKSELIALGENDSERELLDLSVAKRPADELFDVASDPLQLKNVAAEPVFAKRLKELRERLFKELRETNDPRILGKGAELEAFPYRGSYPKKQKKATNGK